MSFDGETYEAEFDYSRLSNQLRGVHAIMLDGRWHQPLELVHAVGGTTASITARIRDLRKEKFGGYVVERRRAGDPTLGKHEYRIDLIETALRHAEPKKEPENKVVCSACGSVLEMTTREELEDFALPYFGDDWPKAIRCEDGWNDLIYDALKAMEFFDPDFEIQQIKEKWGLLDIYASSPTRNLDMHRVANVARERSGTICERCGAVNGDEILVDDQLIVQEVKTRGSSATIVKDILSGTAKRNYVQTLCTRCDEEID